jgi:hypothetical protein
VQLHCAHSFDTHFHQHGDPTASIAAAYCLGHSVATSLVGCTTSCRGGYAHTVSNSVTSSPLVSCYLSHWCPVPAAVANWPRLSLWVESGRAGGVADVALVYVRYPLCMAVDKAVKLCLGFRNAGAIQGTVPDSARLGTLQVELHTYSSSSSSSSSSSNGGLSLAGPAYAV